MPYRALTLVSLGLSLSLAACNTTQPQATAPQPAPAGATDAYRATPAGVTPQGFALPTGSGCQGDIARWAAIQDNDLKTGHVSKSVYDRIQGEINEARTACAAGNSAQASALVRASRARHGYPG
jgi:hypothetical protein